MPTVFAADAGFHMIHPKRDLLLALMILGASLLALTYAAFGPGVFDSSTPRQVALAAGGLGAFFGSFLSLNFWRAVRLSQRLAQGKGAIAVWTIQPDQMRAFLAADTRLEGPRNLWRPSVEATQRPVTFAFGPEVIVADGMLYSIPSAGMQSMRGVTLRPWTPPMLEFSTQIVTTRPGVVGGLLTVKSLLRVPAPDLAQAVSLRRYYQGILDGQTVIAPGRWILRIKLGLWGAAVGAASALTGWFLAGATHWRADDLSGQIALLMLLTGPLLILGGLVLALIAWRLHKIQHGRR
ncbi:MAG: hypothetical protein WAT09_12630 [Paracoccaceae bacterium]